MPIRDVLPIAASRASSTPLLRIEGLSVRFGGIVALEDVSIDVEAGQICGLIGPNGAGKTTLVNCLRRLHQSISGTILFSSERLLELHAIVLPDLGSVGPFSILLCSRR
jgi:branched-chain amino acid transport system ATP-binding protein